MTKKILRVTGNECGKTQNTFGGKSHSQELRFALFELLAVKLGRKPDNATFLRFYHGEMVQIIESVKEEIKALQDANKEKEKEKEKGDPEEKSNE